MNLPYDLLPLRQQADLRNGWLKTRLQTIIPALMRREQIDMWLVVCREYNEDPVIMSLLPEPAMSARRRTILVFALDAKNEFHALTLSRYGYAGFYEGVWKPDEEDQYECLGRIIDEYDPKRIGLNMSVDFAFGDGISKQEHDRVMEALSPTHREKIVSAERLTLGYLETRLPEEIIAYPRVVEIGHAIIAEAYSTRVIHPGITTAHDVIWWMRQTMHEHGLLAWFQPSIEIQAPGQHFSTPNRKVIQPGDLIHCDMGFKYLGLNTDQQQHAYVLRPNETDAPQGLKAALAQGNRLQDIHMEEMQIGRTGNEVLHETLRRARAEGLTPQVYSHPLGYHGHAAGPTIGLWDQQGGVPGKGDYEIFDNTAYSIELNVVKAIPEWDGQEVRIALEEDAVMVNGQMRWLDGRQDRFHLIG